MQLWMATLLGWAWQGDRTGGQELLCFPSVQSTVVTYQASKPEGTPLLSWAAPLCGSGLLLGPLTLRMLKGYPTSHCRPPNPKNSDSS